MPQVPAGWPANQPGPNDDALSALERLVEKNNHANGKTPGKGVGKSSHNAFADMEKSPEPPGPYKYMYSSKGDTAPMPHDTGVLKTAPFGGKPGPLCGKCPLRGRGERPPVSAP